MLTDALQRALLSLQGLTCGDCFGEAFFLPGAQQLIAARILPPDPWPFTDDTLMAVSILNTLRRDATIHPEHLACSFSTLYDPARAYGPAMHSHLLRLAAIGPEHWQRESQGLFNGRGSFGNGAAMRVAPLGAFFADRPDLLIDQARLSAIVTHSHQDAIDGAVAVAAASSLAWNSRNRPAAAASDTLTRIADLLPPGLLHDGLLLAATLPPATSAVQAAHHLGNGSRTTAADTVPLALWCAATWPDSYEQALWHTVSALGDRDTTCAIVGGIVILRTGQSSIPRDWLARAEPPWHLISHVTYLKDSL